MLKKAYDALCRLLPYRVAKTYLLPLRYRNREIRAYQPKPFFDSYYSLHDRNSDSLTVSPDADPLPVRYHYNQVENGIIEFMTSRPTPRVVERVLDVGSGAGHWVDFYLHTFRAVHVTAVEISTVATNRLAERFRSLPVTVINGSIAEAELAPETFDVINAIGVMFHIVDDEELGRVIGRFAGLLRRRGVIIISGQFGLLTRNTQFHRSDTYASWTEAREISGEGPVLVDKRVRSVFQWKRLLRRHGLRIHGLKRHRGPLNVPENNLLFAGRTE